VLAQTEVLICVERADAWLVFRDVHNFSFSCGLVARDSVILVFNDARVLSLVLSWAWGQSFIRAKPFLLYSKRLGLHLSLGLQSKV
jgi:hypothetical protein